MKNHKNIDELFRERFQGAEVTPPPSAWANIADRLPEKKKKRLLIPIWYKMAGVAALLLLSFTLTFQYFTSSPVTQMTNKSATPNLLFNEDDLFDSFENQLSETSGLLEKLLQQSDRMKQEKNIVIAQQETDRTSEEVAQTEEIILSEVVEQSEGITSSDSGEMPSAEVKENTQPVVAVAEEKLSAAEEPFKKVDLEKEISGRLSISTRATPLFGESAAEGGSGASFSYGVSVAYNISGNISLRAGINRMDLSYATAGVPFVGQPAGIAEAGNVTLLAAPEANETEQRADFLEVPLEMKYTLIDKKINLNLIGGGSLLFLNSNPSLPQVPGFARTMVQQQEPEDFGLTTNLGIGLGYELLQQLEIHVEPIMKIRVSSKDAALSPYYFGIYSGFSYRF